jgi:hypothetical protein
MAAGASLGCALALLGACASGHDYGDLYSEPGKFRFLDCATIAQRSLTASKKEQELVSLMERAKQDAGGSLVGSMVYGPDLNTTQSELAQLRREAAEKKCGDAPASPPSASPPSGRPGAASRR